MIYCLQNDTQQQEDLIFCGQFSRARGANKVGRFLSPYLPPLFQIKITPSLYQEGHDHLMSYICLGDHDVLLTNGRNLSTTMHASVQGIVDGVFNPLTAELNPFRHLLALVGARHIVHFNRIRVNLDSCVAGILLDGLLGYLTFQTAAFDNWHIQGFCFSHTSFLYFV